MRPSRSSNATLSNRLLRTTAEGSSNPYSQVWKQSTDRAARARRPSSPAARLVRSDGAMHRGYPRTPRATRAVSESERRDDECSVESHYVPASVAIAVPDLTDGFLALGLALVVSLL